MIEDHLKDNPELQRLYRRYEEAPSSHNFAPLADACRKAGLLEEAVTICLRGLEAHPDYSSGHVVLGKCLYDQGRSEEAREAFERVLDMDRENLVALKYLGIIFAGLGNIPAAQRHFKRFLILDPDNGEIREKLEDLDPDDGEEILELTPIENEAFEGEAIELKDSSLETSDVLATMTLADIFASQGYRGKAIKIYEEVLGKDPSNTIVREKLQALTATRTVDSQESVRTEKTPWDDSCGDEESDDWSDDPPVDARAAELPDEEDGESPAAEEQAGESGSKRRRKHSPPKSDADDETTIADEKSLNQFRDWLKKAGK